MKKLYPLDFDYYSSAFLISIGVTFAIVSFFFPFFPELQILSIIVFCGGILNALIVGREPSKKKKRKSKNLIEEIFEPTIFNFGFWLVMGSILFTTLAFYNLHMSAIDNIVGLIGGISGIVIMIGDMLIS